VANGLIEKSVAKVKALMIILANFFTLTGT